MVIINLMWFWFLLLISVIQFEYGFSNNDGYFSHKKFPKNFLFGVSTGAYQIEGAWNVDGKGESIWDHKLHTMPNFTQDGSNGDVACDSYHKYKEDIKLLKELGVNTFRLSISWPRILPMGTTEFINKKGIEHYRSLIKELLANNIQPLVTIYHWDMPQILSERGGFLNKEFIDWYIEYARVLFEQFGDLVKFWTTFNEPHIHCSSGYGTGIHAPGYKRSGVFDYICGHNLIKAHARAYHLYDKMFRATQKGIIGIILAAPWAVPGSTSDADVKAAETLMQFQLGWFANPIYLGDYPEIMKSRIAKRSIKLEGRLKSRLPVFTFDEIEYIRGTHDYFGLNHYSSTLVYAKAEAPASEGPSMQLDMSTNNTMSKEWEPTCIKDEFAVTPFGMRKVLAFIKERYNNPSIFITENGRCDHGGLDDDSRIYFIKSYLSNVLEAMDKDGVDVKGYLAWSFLDSFEWNGGFVPKFGLYQVDFKSENLTRIPKKSSYAYKKIISTRCLVDKCEDEAHLG